MAKLIFTHSAMNAGKSARLLQCAHNYAEQGQEILLYTTVKPTAVGDGRISSRIGIQAVAQYAGPNFSFLSATQEALETKKLVAIFIDEAQFLTERHVKELIDIVDNYCVSVSCYGLKVDFQGRLFDGARSLIENADVLEKIENRCFCGSAANYNLRVCDGEVVREGPTVLIGETTHVAVCRKHFYEGKFGQEKMSEGIDLFRKRG